MTPAPSGHICILGLVFFSLKSPLEIVRQQSREKFPVLSLKPWSDVVKIPIYLTWAISYDLTFQPKHGPYAESLKRAFSGFSTLLTNGASRFLFLKGKLKVLEALPKPLKNSYKQTNRTYEYNGIPIFRTSKGNENWFKKSAVRKLEGFIERHLFIIWNWAGG